MPIFSYRLVQHDLMQKTYFLGQCCLLKEESGVQPGFLFRSITQASIKCSCCVGVPSAVSLVQGLEWHQEGGLDIAQVEIEYYMGLN